MSKTILIVDDDKDFALGLMVRLKANGYKTAIAYDAALAATIARREKPDLIILDLGLPGGDGILVLDRLRNNMQLSIPVVVLSARDVSTNKQRALKAGALAYFQKPADNDELLSWIEELFKG